MYIHIQLAESRKCCLYLVKGDSLGLDNLAQGACPQRSLNLPLSAVINDLKIIIQGWGLFRFLTSILACQLVLSLCSSVLDSMLLGFHECSFPGAYRSNCLVADANSIFLRKFWTYQHNFLFEYSVNGFQTLLNTQPNRQL